MLEIPNFADKLVEAVRAKKSILIAGLDPQLRYIPRYLQEDMVQTSGKTFKTAGLLFARFNRMIIDAVADYVVAVKPQIAFYEAYGHWGLWAYEETLEYAHRRGLLTITDAKRGDGGDTADAYADGHLGAVPFWGESVAQLVRTTSPFRTDCMTVNGYIGDDCIMRFVRPVKEYGAGLFVVAKSSFKPDSRIEQLDTASGLKVWQEMANCVRDWGEGTEGMHGYRNVGMVMGATKPSDAPWMREALPNCWKLIPGAGGQGATSDEAVTVINDDGLGGVVNDARNLTYAYMRGGDRFQRADHLFESASREYAKEQRDALNNALRRANKYHF